MLLILWLGSPSKEGYRKDCYSVFQQMVQREDLLQDWETLEVEIKGFE